MGTMLPPHLLFHPLIYTLLVAYLRALALHMVLQLVLELGHHASGGGAIVAKALSQKYLVIIFITDEGDLL